MNSIVSAMKRIPRCSWLLLAGVFALLGSPPFGTFISEFTIMRQMVAEGHWLVLAVFIVLLTVIFYSMVKRITAMIFASSTLASTTTNQEEETFLAMLPQWLFLAALVVLGLKLPWQVHSMLKEAAALLGGN
jgi:hydrogenase-4 component F